MSTALCPSCSRPISPPLPDLPTVVLEQLDRQGPTSARTLAATLHRRAADVRSALHELAAAGLIELIQPTASPRSRRWATLRDAGRAPDAHSDLLDAKTGSYVAPINGASPDVLNADSLLLATLSAETRLGRQVAGASLALVAAAALLRPISEGGLRA